MFKKKEGFVTCFSVIVAQLLFIAKCWTAFYTLVALSSQGSLTADFKDKVEKI